MNANDLSVEGMTATEFLKYKEMNMDETWYIYDLALTLSKYTYIILIKMQGK